MANEPVPTPLLFLLRRRTSPRAGRGACRPSRLCASVASYASRLLFQVTATLRKRLPSCQRARQSLREPRGTGGPPQHAFRDRHAWRSKHRVEFRNHRWPGVGVPRLQAASDCGSGRLAVASATRMPARWSHSGTRSANAASCPRLQSRVQFHSSATEVAPVASTVPVFSVRRTGEPQHCIGARGNRRATDPPRASLPASGCSPLRSRVVALREQRILAKQQKLGIRR